MTARDGFLSAEYWDTLVQRDPTLVLPEVERAIATDDGDADLAAMAHGARARALHELGRIDDARSAAHHAVGLLAEAVDDDVRRAVAMSSAVILAESGAVDDGLAVVDTLVAGGEGVDLARVHVQRGYILSQAGRLNEALVAFEAAGHHLGSEPDPRDELRLHQNRGLVLLQQGRLDAADDDFRAAEAIARGAGFTSSAALSVASRAVVHGRARRLPQALRLFEQAAELFEQAGNPDRTVAVTEIDRAEVLLHSGLIPDALDAARRVLRLVVPTGNQVLIGDAQLLLARIELEAGMYRAAQATAARAAEGFERFGRDELVPQARSIGARAELGQARDSDQAAAALDDTDDLAGQLSASGWQRQADEFLGARARVANAHGLLDRVDGELEHLRLGAWSDRRDLALIGWYAEALSRRRAGDLDAALDACRSGLARLDEIVAEADSLERRSAVMRLGNDLSRLTIECAVDADEPHVVWAAAEGTRARALHDELAAPTRHRALGTDDAIALQGEVVARLGRRSMVEWVVANQRVLAVVLGEAGVRLVDVGDLETVTRIRDRIAMWLDIAASEPGGSSLRARTAAVDLDELLIGPLDLPADEGIVIVPVDLLHGVPWAALPSLIDRPFSLSPSARVWLGADRRARAGIRTVGVVVGPDVAGADIELAAITRLRADAAIASGDAGTAAALRAKLADVDHVHLAAHGSFRSDRPLLSTVRLTGGAATLPDTVPGRVHTRLVVLSSCEAGAQGTADGSEVLGFAAVLLARGTASVLAPLSAVRDLECGEFVAEVYDDVAAGETVACAMADVRRRWLVDDHLGRWAVASAFGCFGSGAVHLHRGG